MRIRSSFGAAVVWLMAGVQLAAAQQAGGARGFVVNAVARSVTVAASPRPRAVAFQISNSGPHSEALTLECTAAGVATACVPSARQVSVGVGDTVRVYAKYVAARPGTGSIRLIASGQEVAAEGSMTVQVASSPQPEAVVQPLAGSGGNPYVTPKGAVTYLPTGGHELQFYIENRGAVADTFTVTCSRTNYVASCIADEPKIYVRAGEVVPYTAYISTSGGAVSGTATLTVQGATTNQGSYTVYRQGTVPAPSVEVLTRNPGVRLERSECVISSAGPGVAAQCGDLVAVHELAAFKTMNRDRRLTLFYNSATASVRPVLLAMVRNNSSLADSMIATLTVIDTFRYRFASAPSSGAPVQIALSFARDSLPTGVYPYILTVASFYGGAGSGTTVTGDLVIVNRKQSPYGSGWWVAGVDRLHFNQRNGAVLLVGGDGSARVYEALGSDRYLAARGVFRDTIVKNADTTSVDSLWSRRELDRTTTYYNRQGRQRFVSNPAGELVKYDYNTAADTALIGVRISPYAASKVFTLAYDAAGKLDSIMDPGARTTQVTVLSGQLTSVTDPGMPAVGFGYTSGLLSSRTSERGFTTSYTYWTNTNALKQATLPATQGGSGVIDFKPVQAWGLWLSAGTAPVDSASVKVEVNGARTDVTDLATFVVNGALAPVKVTDPVGAVTSLAYGDSVMPAVPTMVTMPNGRIVKYSWNANGKLFQRRDSTWHVDSLSTRVDSLEYNSAYTSDLPSRSIDAAGLATSYAYTRQGLLSTVTAPGGHVSSYSYATRNGIANLLQSITEEAVQTINDSLTAETATNLRTAFAYDSLGNMVADTSPKGNVNRYVRDTYGRVQRHYDPENDSIAYAYDNLNRVTSSTQYDAALGALATRYVYLNAVLDTVVDPRGVKRSFRYDALDRLTSERDDYGARDSLFLNRAGMVDSVRTRRNLAIKHFYNAAGRDTLTRWPARADTVPVPQTSWITVVVPGDTVRSAYDLMGNLTEARSGGFKVARSHYANGLLRQEVQSTAAGSNPFTNVYWYDAAGRRTKYQVGSGVGTTDTVYYGYNGSTGMLSSVAVRWRNGYGDTVSFQVDSLGRRHRSQYSGNSGIGITYGYDADGQLRLLCSTHSSVLPVDVFKVRMAKTVVDRDGLVRTLSMLGTAGCPSNSIVEDEGSSYTYDSRHQLLTANRHADTLRYDASGNMVLKVRVAVKDTMQVDAGHNRLTRRFKTAAGHIAYDYTQDGARRSERNYYNGSDWIEDGSFRAYQYDALGRNTGYRYFEWDGVRYNAVDLFNICAYDPVGRMKKPCENTNAYLGYDGENVVRTAADNALGWSIVHGPGTDDPLMAYHPGEPNETGRIYYITDGQGRQYGVGWRTGQDYSTSSLYELGAKWAGGTTNAHSFEAERFKPATAPGPSFFRNRFYDQNTGRWIQEDPLGIAAGTNMYAYVGNNPAVYTDPFGLCPPEDDNFNDCAPGSSGWYAQRLATGEGNRLLNNVGGVLATCGESLACNAVLAGSGAIAGAMRWAAGRAAATLWPAASGGEATLNGVTYSVHALERMQPVGTIMREGASFSRGVPPSAVQNALRYGAQTPGHSGRTVYTFENVRVISSAAADYVWTVIKMGR